MMYKVIQLMWVPEYKDKETFLEKFPISDFTEYYSQRNMLSLLIDYIYNKKTKTQQLVFYCPNN